MKTNKKGFTKSIASNFEHNKNMKYEYHKFSIDHNFIYSVEPNDDLYDVVITEKIKKDDSRFESLVKPIDIERFKRGWETWVIMEKFENFILANDAMDFINNKYFN